MSARPNKSSTVEDLWTKLENLPIDVEEDFDSTTIFLGDSSSGKSSLIQSFLKPNLTKECKPTFAIDYNFARKKSGHLQSSRNVAHIYELGGDIQDPKLLEIPLNYKALSHTSMVIVLDLSRPQNALSSLQRWIRLARESIKKRVLEAQAIDAVATAALVEATTGPMKAHPNDSSRLRPCEIPTYIVCNKFDQFKASLNLSEKRAVMQLIRFVAHYHGASVLTASIFESTSKEMFRAFMNNACFKSPSKAVCEASIDKPIQITAGKDDFASILLSSLSTSVAPSKDSSSSEKSKLLISENDVANFLTPQGLTKDCWSRFADHLKAMFGSSDVPPGGAQDAGDENDAGNEFPEPDVDDMRHQRDEALQRYMQECERKESMRARVAADETDAVSGLGSISTATTFSTAKAAAAAVAAAAEGESKRSGRK